MPWRRSSSTSTVAFSARLVASGETNVMADRAGSLVRAPRADRRSGASAAASMGSVTVVGMTDEGPASLAADAMALVAEASVLCGGERHLAFFADDVARTAAELQARGVLLASPPQIAKSGRGAVYFYDPDGNVLELCEPL